MKTMPSRLAGMYVRSEGVLSFPSSALSIAQRSGAAQVALDPLEHPGVADLGRRAQRLLAAGAVTDSGGDHVDVGAQCPAELDAGLLGVISGVVVGHEPEQ